MLLQRVHKAELHDPKKNKLLLAVNDENQVQNEDITIIIEIVMLITMVNQVKAMVLKIFFNHPINNRKVIMENFKLNYLHN